jgi:hypothetical protein
MEVSGWHDRLLRRGAALVTASCVVVLGATSVAFFVPALREANTDSAVAYAAGDRIDLDPKTYASTRRTVFLFSRSSCRACQASKPTMAAIVSDLSKAPDVNVILVVQQFPPAEETSFAREVGIGTSRILGVDLRTLRLSSVPTVVVTDSSGTILFAGEGVLTNSDRSAITQAALSSPPR